MTRKEKYRQVKREAIATGLALAALIVYWIFAGFGTANFLDNSIRIAGLPLWVVLGTLGTWAMALVIVALLLRFVFRDMPLDDEEARKGGKA